MSPERTNLVLAPDIPNIELCVLVRDGLDVEADGGNGGDVLVELELVEDGCARLVFGQLHVDRESIGHTGLAGGVEAQHQQAHLLGAEDLAHHLGY